jgi:zinc transport system substrate-binding protein
MVSMSARRRAAACLLLVGALAVSGCGANSGVSGSSDDGETAPKLHLVASFYPLQWVARQVAGPGTVVDSLTRPGAEPHDLELTPRDVASVADADLVVYLRGFQPAVDDAVSGEASDSSLDVAPSADLNLTYTPIEEGEEHAEEKGATDPHFWLDPLRLAAVADALSARLAKLDHSQAAEFRANAAKLTAKLEALDHTFKSGLADCANPNLVTSHNAFGYLAQRYGLTQIGITGMTPEDEPKPADLAATTSFVREHHVRTIYYETLVSPAIARTVAAETGARTAVLDPIEGLTSDSLGRDYLQVMRSNLTNIEQGQPCP